MTEGSDTARDLSAELARLRREVDALIAEAAPFVADAADRARSAAKDVTDSAQAQLESLADRVKERPLTAVCVAAGLGYVLARLLHR